MRESRIRQAGLCTVLLCVLWGASVSGWGADLLETYRLAQANDPTFEAAKQALEAARQKIPEARAGLLPSVNMSGNASNTHATTTFAPSPALDRDVQAWAWTIQLTQPLIRIQNVFAYRESKSIVEQAEAQFSQAEQALILRVARAYFDVVSAREAIAAAEAQVRAMEEQLAQATHGHQVGTLAVTDVYEAKSRRDLAMAQLVVARNELSNTRTELGKIVGHVAYPLAKLKPGAVTPQLQPSDSQSWSNQARESNPAVIAQKASLAAAREEVSRNRAEHLPTLDLNASYGRNYSSGSLTWPTDYSTLAVSRQAGVQLNVPIFSGGASSARVKASVANQFKAQADLEAARRQAAADADQAYVGIENGVAEVEALESAVQSSRNAVKGSLAGFKLGIRTNIDVLNAQQQLYGAIRDLAKARYESLYQVLKLKAAAGILTEADVVEINGQMGEE
ncbi:MAG TPA: TolC family outer membrane protein [Parasulfuritortus sp.]